ncbi:HNH endonuclease [Leptospira meyeri]|uniref:HNH endonuclease n=1 Tax=Leptospira meyeri TaxID=29508 RepID=UPI0010839E71|nr:HNH endonuclease [Leptospira meyeri]TGM60099.1 HNH endonuclease [Leptospira meyeri]
MNRWKIPIELENEIRKRDIFCVYCNVMLDEKVSKGNSRKNAATWEHIINDATIINFDNIARCCSACNSSKGTKKLADWIKSEYCKKNNININTVAPIIKKALEILN